MSYLEQSQPPEKELLEPPSSTAVVPTEANEESGAGRIGTTPSKVEKAYAGRLASGEVTSAQVEALVWFLSMAKAERLSLKELAKKVEMSSTTLHRAFGGDYKAGLVNLVTAIEGYRKLYTARQSYGKTNFVETGVVQSLWQFCDYVRANGLLACIYGDSQLGKSFALREYQSRNNHGATLYMPVPAMGGFTRFLRRLNQTLGENGSAPAAAQHDTPFGVLNENKLLILDEFHQCLIVNGRGGIRSHTVEYVKDLHEQTRCPMILCMTNVGRSAMEKGVHQALLEQTRRRGVDPLQLPKLLPQGDMDLIAATYGLPPANQAVHQFRCEVILRSGLKAYVTYLRTGMSLANNRKEPFGWGHVIKAHDVLARLSAGEEGGAK